MRKIAVLFMTAMLLSPAPAFADCVSECQASTYCGGDSYECSQLQAACYRRECSGNDSAPAKRLSGEYGAIAYGKDSQAYGLADSSASKAAAKKSALGYCGRHGKDCEIVETFSNTCAAIAQDTDGNVGWNDDDDKKDAMKGAIKACTKKSDDKNCHVTLVHCYSE